MNLSQPNGAICIVAPIHKVLNSSILTDCPTTPALKKTDYPTGNTTLHCQPNIILGLENDATPDINYSINVTDGVIQVEYTNKPNLTEYPHQVFDYLRDTVQLTHMSAKMLKKDSALITSNINIDRANQYKVVAPNYYSTWVYATNEPMMAAKFWTLSAVSLNLLTPVYETEWLYFADSKCPMGNKSSFALNGELMDVIDSKMPLLEQSIFAHEYLHDQYYTYKHNADGSVISVIVPFGGKTGLNIIAFMLSFLLAFMGCCLLLTTSILTFRYMQKKIQQYLENQRNESMTKKLHVDPMQVKLRNNAKAKIIDQSQVMDQKRLVLAINMFSAKTEH